MAVVLKADGFHFPRKISIKVQYFNFIGACQEPNHFFFFFFFSFYMIQVYCTGQQASLQQDEAYYIYKDFKEILQSEVYVDLERLRILARHGIPNELRGVK